MPRHKYGAEPAALQPKSEELSQATDTEAISSAPLPPPVTRPIKQQARAIQARWAGEKACEDELRSFFLTQPLDKALAVLAKMRENCTTGGTIINERINATSDQKCETCQMTYEELKRKGKPDWWLNRPHYDENDRNIIHVKHYCSAACVSMANNKSQGTYGIADRGMLASDNPKNHPRQTHAAQTELTKG